MLYYVGAEQGGGHVVKGVLPEEVVPEDEDWGDFLVVQVVVPFFKDAQQLVAFFAGLVLGEIEEFHFPVHSHH